MPYSSTSELPEPVRSKYSEKCQRAYMHAFNSVYEDTNDEGRASAAGHSAAQDCEGTKSMALTTTDEFNSSPIRFSIFTRAWDPDVGAFVPAALKASKGPDGKMRLHGIASSTVKDLHGDTMLLSALEDMERAANQNLTIFGNHEYTVPEDVYGSVENARLKQAGTVDGAGEPVYDLAFDVVVNEKNDRAVKTWEAIDGGTKLGLSIGAMIPEGGATRSKKTGAYTIAHVDLLETSVVGIPANPRSWVENAVKSIRDARKAATTVPLGSPQLTLDTDAGTYQIKGNLADVGLAVSKELELLETDQDGIEVPEGGWATKHEECGFAQQGTFENGICPKCGSTGPFMAFPASEMDATDSATNPGPEVTDAATCPDCGRGKSEGGDCPNPFHTKDVEPDVTDAKVTIIEVDTGSSSSEPVKDETADGDDEALGDDTTMAAQAVIDAAKGVVTGDLNAEVTSAFQQLLDLTQTLIREWGEAKTGERQALAAKATAEQQRDDVIRQAGQLIGQTNTLIQKLADLRVGPRAVIREAGEEISTLAEIYSTDFMDLLKRKNA